MTLKNIIISNTKKHNPSPNSNGILIDCVFSNKYGDKKEFNAAANSGTVSIKPIAVPNLVGILYAIILKTAICKISLAIPNIALPHNIIQ